MIDRDEFFIGTISNESVRWRGDILYVSGRCRGTETSAFPEQYKDPQAYDFEIKWAKGRTPHSELAVITVQGVHRKFNNRQRYDLRLALYRVYWKKLNLGDDWPIEHKAGLLNSFTA